MEPRIISPLELEKEALFMRSVKGLEKKFKVSKIDYDLALQSNHPLIIVNGSDIPVNVRKEVFKLFKQIFDKNPE